MIKYDVKDATAVITLNYPEKKNALNPLLVKGLKKSISEANSDRGIKSIILTGEGDAFCAGADLSYLQQIKDNSVLENEADSRSLAEMFLMVYNSDKPVIAAVNGGAIAGGCGLASVCDIIIADKDKAKLGYSEVKIGFIPAIVSLFLIRRIGEGKAKYLLLTGDIISAVEAKELGLVNIVADDVVSEAMAVADKLNNNSLSSIKLTKKMINTVSAFNMDDAVEYCLKLNTISRTTEDFAVGIDNFLNRR